MPQKLALKRLTASDLTFFEWQFSNHNAGNQKAINLNADIFINKLYPSLPEIARDRGERFPLDINLYGPGLKSEYNLQRKIVKGHTYKNWRLNGEFVHNPANDSERFNVLKPNDFALFSFEGDLFPHSASIYMVAAAQTEDTSIHAALAQLLGDRRRSMIEITQQTLDQLFHEVELTGEHPLYDLLLEDALIDAAQNGIAGIQQLSRTVSRRSVSYDSLKQARAKASRIGRIGEEFVNNYLQRQKNIRFNWVADENAISPYDFEISYAEETILADVKSTEGKFDRPVHISFNEILQMGQVGQYRIYRVYDIEEATAKLRISQDMTAFAQEILRAFDNLPDGVRPDSISVSPNILDFGEVISLTIEIDDF